VFSPWTRGNGHERFVSIVAEGQGSLEIELGNVRVGQQRLVLSIGGGSA
jgi:hypothetical protein